MSRIGRSELGDSVVNFAKVGPGMLAAKSFLYDFTVLGGAVGSVTLTAPDGTADTLPAGMVIVGMSTKTLVAMTSGGSATVALNTTSNTAKLLAALAYNDSKWDVAGDTNTALAVTGTVVTAAAEAVTATIATAALTAGKFLVNVFFYAPAL